MIDSEAKISDVKYGLDSLSFTSESEKTTAAIIKINYFKPHWRAYINGNEVQISEAWPEFMSISVPAGQNKVLFKYETNTLHIVSWFITFLTIVLGVYYIRK